MPRGEDEAAAEAPNSLVNTKDEPPRLLSASSWMTSEAGPSTRGEFVASTIDVDAIKRSPERYDRPSKEPLMTIPENWATIEPPNSNLSKKTTSQNESDEESEDSDSNESDSNESLSSESGSCSSCSTCSNATSDDSDDDSSSTTSDLNNSKSALAKSKQQQKVLNNKSRFMAFKSKTHSQSLMSNLNDHQLDSSPVKHVQAGFLSQAETCKNPKLKLQKVLNNSSKSSASNSVSSRKFFKRKQQSTVSNGPSYRQHQPSHHNHQQNTTSTASGSCVMERLHGGSTSTTNSSSSTVSHLQATATEEHHNLQQQSTSVATTESIDHHFAEHYTSSGHSQNHHANSDHTFHPISASEGLQVIEDEDLVAILKDVSGDTFDENNRDCNYCDITGEKPAAGQPVKKSGSVHNKISTAEIVTEAIQRIDSSHPGTGTGKSSGLGSGSSSRMENRVEGNKKLLVQQQRQRHSSTKKNRKKSGYQPILPAPTPSDIDLYLNSNSNVSPDSGIQSEPGGLTNSSPPQILPGNAAGNSGSNSGNNETVLQFSPGSTTTVYTQWPPNGYFSGISTGQDCYSTGTNPGYILSNSGTTLMAVVTPVQTAQHTTNAQTQNPVSDNPDLQSGPTILPTPIMLENPASDILNPMIKRGRGRPKGSKNKKKTLTCESGCQTIESSLESGSATGSKKSESPISVFDEDEEPPPPVIFLESRDHHPDISDRTPSKIRKDPPRLEPQVELRNSGDRSASAGLSDSDTIMFSDGEDDPDPEPPVIRIPELPPTVKLKKKKKKKNRNSEDHPENLPPTLSKPKKQKRKKRNKEYLRAISPPLLEPIGNPVKSPVNVVPSSVPEFRPIRTSDYSSSKSPEEELFPKSPIREEPEFPSSPPQISIPEIPEIPEDNSETFEEVPVEVSPVVSPARSSKPDSADSENDDTGPPILTVPDDEQQQQPVDKPIEPSTKPDKEPAEEPFQFCELKPVFSAKYRTLKVDKFWKTKKKKSKKESSVTTNNQPMVQTIPQVVTKAAVKEIVNVPLKSSSTTSSTKTMLAVLKSTNLKSKPGRRKKKGSSSSTKFVKEQQQQCFSPKSVHSSTDESESKSKKSINKSLIEMGWRTKHKNVIDPLFLGLLEQMIQDMSNIQMDKKLSKDLWPDRPNSSLPTIFKKRKFIQETTSKVTKRGRPKKTEAEQRLPLKKRHHHVDSSESKDQKGRISRKASTEDQKKSNKNQASSTMTNVNKNTTTTQLSTNQTNATVSSKNIVDSIAACVDKYTSKKDFSQPLTVSIQENQVGQPKPSTTPRKRHLLQMQDNQNESAPPTLEMEKTSEKSRERPSSPPKLTKFDEMISNKNNPLTSPISEDETRRPTPPNMYRPKVSDISDASDVDPISPKVIKIMKHNDVMHCSVKLKKLSEGKNVDQQKEQAEPIQDSNLVQVEEKSNEEEVERLTTNKDNLLLKKKKKRKANKTGFPAIKKKKKVMMMSKDDEKTSQNHHHSKRKSQKVLLKKVQAQPSRASPRILENKSDTDSRPSSRLEQSTVTSIKVIEQPKRPETPTSEAPPPTKRSKLYEDIDENIDCLGLLPPQENTEEVMEIVEEKTSSSKRPKKRGIHLFKKNYLIAGLFSNFYKETDPLKQRNLVPISKVQYNESDHIHGLLPPPYYCGRQLREKKEDFTLPYDLWWQNANKQLPGRDVVPTWNYRRIKSNVYFDVAKPMTKGYEMQACQCKRCDDENIDLQPCREDCINRMTYTECDNDLCHHPEDKCANRRIQQQKFSKTNIERFMTVNKGWGIKTKIPILNGDFIMEYVGEVVSEKEFKLRMLTEYVEDTHHYCLHLDGGTVIDGHRMGNECRFVNHSCQPNCEMQKWNVNGVFRMALFALTDIGIDEELTYDYNFSLFNPHEGQKCRCLSKNCRGVIGGKTQRIAIVEPSSSSSKSKRKQERTKAKKEKNHEAFSLMTSLKPLTAPQKSYAKEHHCFLVRNYEKVRVFREALKGHFNDKTQEMIKTGLTALSTARSVQTRKLAIAQDDPKVTKMVKLAQVLKDILNQLDQDLLKHFKDLPNRKKYPLYYELIEEPIDLSTIENRVNSGSYDPWQFDQDLIRLFQNHLRFYGSEKPEGKASLTLKNQYNEIKLEYLAQLEEASEQILTPGFCQVKQKPKADLTEASCDVIDCPCGQFKEEGTMIQCEKCQIWQHLDCVTPPEDPDLPYFCGKCSGQKPDLDIRIVPQPDHYPGDIDYVSLMRGNLQIRLDDTVYVLRAGLPKSGSGAVDPDSDEGFNLGGIQHKMMSPVKGPSQEASKLCNYPSYKDMPDESSVENMDIFRVERLWINNKGERFAFGYHYLRPNETFHEASRKFFRNEVFRIPIYEVLPLDSIWRQCWVLDLATFCKGRPKGALEEDVYICEYRVDKKARLFDKIPKSSSKSNSKNKFPAICTKWFAFDCFDIKLKPVRSYTPHEVPEKWKPPIKNHGKELPSSSSSSETQKKHISLLRIRRREKLDTTLTRLLSQLPNANDPWDASFLLKRKSSKAGNKNKKAN